MWPVTTGGGAGSGGSACGGSEDFDNPKGGLPSFTRLNTSSSMNYSPAAARNHYYQVRLVLYTISNNIQSQTRKLTFT